MKKHQNLIYSDDFTICYGPCNESIGMLLTSLKLHKDCTSIAISAFQKCENLEKVYIENPSFKEIGEVTFEGCTSLKDVTILSDKEIDIGQAAFYNTNIENLKISQFQYKYQEFDENFKKTLKNLYLVVFYKYDNHVNHFFMPDDSDEFSNLENITIVKKEMDPNHTYFKMLKNGTIEPDEEKTKIIEHTMKDFIYDKYHGATILTAYPPAKKDKIVHVPKNIEYISMNSFILNPYIEKIYIDSTIEMIESDSFSKCDNLKEIVIKSDNILLENNIAAKCPNLRNIYLTTKAYQKNIETVRSNPLYKTITLDVLLDEGCSFKNINSILKDIQER